MFPSCMFHPEQMQQTGAICPPQPCHEEARGRPIVTHDPTRLACGAHQQVQPCWSFDPLQFALPSSSIVTKMEEPAPQHCTLELWAISCTYRLPPSLLRDQSHLSLLPSIQRDSCQSNTAILLPVGSPHCRLSLRANRDPQLSLINPLLKLYRIWTWINQTPSMQIVPTLSQPISKIPCQMSCGMQPCKNWMDTAWCLS